ncbi:uncharacterized protein FPOAC1_013233 [Fusarium poae]|uniref:uncharacterized protein n=1 Tax=Fusarium poae TaxID=36050 RepID=UPI001D047AC3|nr:uncharacterized protein FPOAC1_013233 [Fusarium poae]KAG8665254.1 hypothetical protein FPOAC1_013233 [Fusarium poae]
MRKDFGTYAYRYHSQQDHPSLDSLGTGTIWTCNPISTQQTIPTSLVPKLLRLNYCLQRDTNSDRAVIWGRAQWQGNELAYLKDQMD